MLLSGSFAAGVLGRRTALAAFSILGCHGNSCRVAFRVTRDLVSGRIDFTVVLGWNSRLIGLDLGCSRYEQFIVSLGRRLGWLLFQARV